MIISKKLVLQKMNGKINLKLASQTKKKEEDDANL